MSAPTLTPHRGRSEGAEPRLVGLAQASARFRKRLHLATRVRVAAGVFALGAVVVTGCATPRAALGTSTSPCFQALPVASEAVGHQGRFAGVARVAAPAVANLPNDLRPRPPRSRAHGPGTSGVGSTTSAPSAGKSLPSSGVLRPIPTTLPAAPDALPSAAAVGPGQGGVPTTMMRGHALCLVAFRGTFDATRIPLLQGIRQTGKYAVVVVGVRTRRAGAVFLTDRLPRSFEKA